MENVALSICAKNKYEMPHNTRLMMIQSKAVGWQGLMPDEEELAERPDFWEMEPEKEPPPVVRPKMTGADRNIFLRGNVKEPPPWVKKPEPEKQTSKILPLTAEMRAEYEKHDKEWQESKYAKNMPLANARIFSRMSDEEKAELPESIHNYLFMYYEQNKERIKQDEEEQNTRDILGYIPGIGSVAEGISAYHAFEKGSIGEGFLYAVGSVPVGKYAVKGGKVALKSFRKVPRRIFKGARLAKKVMVPEKAKNIIKQVKARNGTPPKGYKGGGTYKNSPPNGGQKLPEGIIYKEYDVNPYVKGQDRGMERIVIGNDGSAWYTNDHYKTFSKIE